MVISKNTFINAKNRVAGVFMKPTLTLLLLQNINWTHVFACYIKCMGLLFFGDESARNVHTLESLIILLY